MKQAFKHLFIPHEHNDYKPHFFREVSVAVLVGIIMFLLGLSAGSSFFVHRTILGANMSVPVLIDLTNESRLANNEAPLLRSELLDKAANLKAENMAEEKYFAHTSPKGITPWYWFKQVGYSFLYAGENLAVNFTDPTDVRDAWLASPKHRENLLDVKFREIGMATVDGLYEGDSSIYIVQLFGTPTVLATSEEKSTSQPQDSSSGQEDSTLATNQQIKGESTSASYESVVDTKTLAVIKNNNVKEESLSATGAVPTYSTWYQRIIFGSPYYVQMLYMVLFIAVLIALISMVVIEIQRQHWKHIVYGLSMLLVITLSALINQAFF